MEMKIVFTLLTVFTALSAVSQSLYAALQHFPIQIRNTITRHRVNAVLQSIPTNVFGVVCGWGLRLQRHALSRQSCFSFVRRVTLGTGWVFTDSQSEVAEAAFDFDSGNLAAPGFQCHKSQLAILEFWGSG